MPWIVPVIEPVDLRPVDLHRPPEINLDEVVLRSSLRGGITVRDVGPAQQIVGIVPVEPETVLERVRITTSQFVGQNRMLVRGLRVLGNPEPVESDARSSEDI
jgi:hypothetical protein